jgi:hypothetical protein
MAVDLYDLHTEDSYADTSDTHVSVTSSGKFLISDVGQLRHLEFLFCTTAASVALGAAAYGVYAATLLGKMDTSDDALSEPSLPSTSPSQLSRKSINR